MRGGGVAALLAAAALAAAGCGGDDEKSGGGPATDGARTQQTAPADAVTDPPTVPERTETVPPTTGGEKAKGKAPENQPGGAGDEKANSAQALITGRSGKLSPLTVKVPAYIGITVELRSADGLDYGLAGAGKRLGAGEGANSDTARFAGLRPGRKLVLVGPQGRVVISATADPGP